MFEALMDHLCFTELLTTFYVCGFITLLLYTQVGFKPKTITILEVLPLSLNP